MKKTKGIKNIANLTELMSPENLRLLSANGKDLVKQIGLEVVRSVVFDVLTGRNLRDSTEVLTRRRVGTLNLATVNLFLKGASQIEDFINQLPYLAVEILSRKNIKKTEKWLAQWVLGLNDKAFQNILRDRVEALTQYRDQYIKISKEIVDNHAKTEGELTGTLYLNSGTKADVDWLMMAYLLNTIGAQTLTIRGSEKSAYGKLFEKLILGSLLHILGFKLVKSFTEDSARVFCLSSRSEKRESDATLLYEKGKGVRFDIGFIGRGNPEISLDKVTRFEREITLGRSLCYMATIILVDRIGVNSSIERLAQRVDGTIIQMSASYWPQRVARELHRSVGFKHALVNMELTKIGAFLEKQLSKVPLEDFIGNNEAIL